MNLHLSHINYERLDLLESDPGVSSKQIADSVAAQTYQCLEEEIQTAITLSLYDMGKLRQYKEKLQAFSTAYNAKVSLRHYSDNVDCKQAQFFAEEIFERGIKVWYKPSGFGREASKNTHSGWGCKPLAEDGRISPEHR